MFTNQTDLEAPILVIGASSMDVVGREINPIQMGTSNPAYIRTSFGGVARNVAENLARLGESVYLVSAVGEDQIGKQLLSHTEQSGVDISCVLKSKKYPTGTYLAVLGDNGHLAFALDDMRAISDLTPGYLRKQYQLFKESSLVFLDSNLPEKTIKTVINQAQKTKTPICADPTSSTLATKLIPYLPDIDIITANPKEAAILTGKDFDPTSEAQAMATAHKLVSLGVGLAIVTMAEFGLSYASAENSGHIPAHKTEITNPTGAGDALLAAVLFALLNNIPEDEAMRLGISAATLTLRHPAAVIPNLSLELLYDHLII